VLCEHCNKQIQKARNCDGTGEPVEIDGFLFEKCPRHYVSNGFWLLLDLFGRYKDGFLMNAGGISDQVIYYIEAMGYMADKISELNNEQKS